MSRKISRISFVSLIFVTLVALLIPKVAYAQSDFTVTPGTIKNNVSNTITITANPGFIFEQSSVVFLDKYGALVTTYLNDSVLTAVVPAGISPGPQVGRYDVKVLNSSAEGICTNCLLVEDSLQTGRPQPVVKSSKINVPQVQYGQEFKLTVTFENVGSADAYDVKVTFTSEDLTPTKNGGMEAVGTIPTGGHIPIEQTFVGTGSFYGKEFVIVTATLTYHDGKGTSYSDSYVLTVRSMAWADVTPTATGVKASQLVITSYGLDIDPLQPGELFTLTMTVQNMGNLPAQRVTMIVGGGSSGGDKGGTPSPGGISGGGGEFTNFAPVGASNIQSLGDIGPGAMIRVSQNLIVNVSTTPGAYPIKITFSYWNNLGEVINDEQVITLLVYDLPKVDISFYRVPGPIFTGQPNVLPIQVANLGKHSAVLGNMKIEASNGFVEPDSTLIGPLDSYFPFDTNLTPDTAGPLTLTITIDYTDDFNKPRTITQTLNLVVEEAVVESVPSPSEGGGDITVVEETFTDKVFRFILGLLGLDSAPASVPADGEIIPVEPQPLPPSGG